MPDALWSPPPPPDERWPLLDEILVRWGARRILTPGQFAQLSLSARRVAGRLAGVWETKFVQAIYDSIGKALGENLSSADWMTEAQKILDAYGGGTKLGLYSGESFTPWYAETVFRTNVQSALAAGRYADLFSPAGMQMAEYWMFYAILDDRNDTQRKCPGMICRTLNGKVFSKDDAAANRLLCPLHFKCRCSIIELSQDDVDAGGYDIANGSDFEALLQTEGVWGDDKLVGLVHGPEAPMAGVNLVY
jgi:SPP1 gp7 family putative phage head morphogenesis protein